MKSANNWLLIALLQAIWFAGPLARSPAGCAELPASANETENSQSKRHTADTNRATVLGIDGTRFTLNGKPTFLLGISYYGALGAPRISFAGIWTISSTTASTGCGYGRLGVPPALMSLQLTRKAIRANRF